MERLTKRDRGGNAVVDCDVCEMGESCLANCSVLKCRNRLKDRLAAYEDAEEQGRLVVLPCKVGDVLFVTDGRTILPARRTVESITWWNGEISIRAVNDRTGYAYFCKSEDFGKTVFLNREEAKKALEGM